MTSAKVAIVDTSVTVRRGLRSVLEEAGFTVVDAESAADMVGADAALISLQAAGDIVGEELREVAAGVPTVALVRGSEIAEVVGVFRAGCCAVIPWEADAAMIVAAVQAVLNGLAAVPRDLAETMAARARISPQQLLDRREAEWLQFLADGRTVAALADEVGYSEREMFRILGDLYQRLGASNRSEALVKAAQLGVFDD